MKTLKWNVLSLFFLMVGGIAAFGDQNRVEVPGDNFSLEGALKLFKQSSSPEEFERLLNSPNSKVNNLDLNGDGHVDYIRVINRNEGNVHVFILQAIVSASESQDVAIISLEKLANGKAVLQITGDEDVYGVETIIEPTEEVRVMAGTTTARNVVNVWSWPAVQYVYSPYYTVWVSPWTWYRHPVWWHTWRPVAWYDYYGWWEPYRPYYVRCYSPRIVYAHYIYRPYRTTSVVVYNRHYTQINHYRTVHRDEHRSSRNHYSDNRGNSYTNDRDRRSNYGDNRSSTNYSDNRSGRNQYTSDRPARNSYQGGTSDRQNKQSFTPPSSDVRQRLATNETTNTRLSSGTPVHRQSTPVTNRTYTSPRADTPANSSPQMRNRPVEAPRNSNAVQTRNSGGMERSEGATVNRSAPQQQSRPAPNMDKGRSLDNPAMNRATERATSGRTHK